VMDLLFRAVAESVEEAVINALLAAESVAAGSGNGSAEGGLVGIPLPVGRLVELLGRSGQNA
jgi:hypothetical protein